MTRHQDRVQEPVGPLSFPGQRGIGLLEGREGGIAFEEPGMGLGVEPHPGGELEPVG